MKRLVLAAAAAFLFCVPAMAQFNAPPGMSVKTPDGQVISADKLPAAQGPVAIGGAVGAPTVVVPPEKEGSVINVGQAFGDFLAPYVNSAIGALITSGLGWLFYLLKSKLGLDIDQKNRDAFQTFLLNEASSLIADGKVTLDNKTVTVNSAALASAVDMASTMIPGAMAHLGITPDVIAQRIVDKIPQVPAGAAMISGVVPAPGSTVPATPAAA